MPASLIALCFGNFIIGTGALIVPGMLPVLAEGLQVSLPAAGQLITAFAFTVCVSAALLVPPEKRGSAIAFVSSAGPSPRSSAWRSAPT